jgi:hypothetical protein
MSLFQSDTNYSVIENTISQNAIKYVDSLDNAAVDKIISIASTGLSLKRDILSTAVETIITPLDITDVTTGNVITMARLTYLPIGLAALTVPSNGTTCNFNDAIQVQDYNATLSPPLVQSKAKLGANPLTLYGLQFTSTETIATTISNNNNNAMNITADGTLTCLGNNLNLNANDNITMTATNDAIDITADDSISLISAGLKAVNLNAPNIDSYSYAMPICFTREREDIFTYNLGGQTMELVYNTSVNVPYQFFSDTPQIGYTSSIWKIDFALNCYDCSNTGDKGIALYIEFQDQASTIYTPITYNLDTPYAVWQPSSSYNGLTHSQFQNFNWSDLINLSSLSGTGSGNVPLNMSLYFAGDSGFNAKFRLALTLTRTNQV